MARWPLWIVGLCASTGLVGALLFVQIAPANDQMGDLPGPLRKYPGHDLNLVVLGTSLARRASWPEAVSQALDRCGLGLAQVQVIAKAGASSTWGLAEVGRVIDLSPDVIILEFAINDADLWDGVSRAESILLHEAIVARLAQSLPEAAIILLTTNPVTGLARLKRPFLLRYYQSYRDIARHSGVGLVDGYFEWSGQKTWRAALTDGLHPDPKIEEAVLAGPITASIGRVFGVECRVDQTPAPKG